jgi:hypothetical protein
MSLVWVAHFKILNLFQFHICTSISSKHATFLVHTFSAEPSVTNENLNNPCYDRYDAIKEIWPNEVVTVDKAASRDI